MAMDSVEPIRDKSIPTTPFEEQIESILFWVLTKSASRNSSLLWQKEHSEIKKKNIEINFFMAKYLFKYKA